MRLRKTYQNIDIKEFKSKILYWANQFDHIAFFDSNNYYSQHKNDFSFNTYESIIGIDSISIIQPKEDSFEALEKFFNQTQDWIFGHLSYDLKNEVENLSSNNIDYVNFPELSFFQAKFVFIIENNLIHFEYFEGLNPDAIIKEILTDKNASISLEESKINVQNRFQKTEYLETIEQVKRHIYRGDIYEANVCQEFYSENTSLEPISTYLNLIEVSPTPFASFYKLSDKFLLSASPERYLKKMGNKLISQPIKGTIKRGKTEEEDQALVLKLKTDKKERAENIMIVDLVRNDLTRAVLNSSVTVEELCGIYSFNQVHQMISTISAKIEKNTRLSTILKNTFPMGSMTGAPKIKAMELIEKFEKTKRGLYSGAVGYIAPNGDFDFNVVIRSILYNSENKYLSFTVGGAITANSKAKKEYDECLLKAKAILEVLK